MAVPPSSWCNGEPLYRILGSVELPAANWYTTLSLSIGITPEVTEAVRQPVPVDEVADIGYPRPKVIDCHIDLPFHQERPFLTDGHFLQGELDIQLGQALFDQDGRLFVEQITRIDRYCDCKPVRYLRLRQFLPSFGQVGFIGPE